MKYQTICCKRGFEAHLWRAGPRLLLVELAGKHAAIAACEPACGPLWTRPLAQ
jgi:hypothetical protein